MLAQGERGAGEMRDANGLSRRAFLRGSGAAVLGLSLGQLALRDPAARPAAAAGRSAPAYAGWQDLYRAKWTWDRVVKGTHFVNCWYQRGCNWDVFVKEGLVFREEQSGSYPQTRAGVPDFNPRGCQKGACYSQRMYDAGRLRHPLKRAGERGEGRWKRVAWEEALREVADATIDALATDGPGSIVWDLGTANTNGCNGMGLQRTAGLLDTPILDTNAEIGDHHPGAAVTVGKICFASSADDLFHSDLILVWGGNPVYTQIPNAHFINESRYHGASVVTIAPDYNASAIHADSWVPVNVGTDAALGLSIASVLVEEGLHDEAFIREQTDLPLLVRRDTQLFLRQSDLEDGGDEEIFYVFDRASGGIREVDQGTLALGDVDPALEGEFEVATRDGTAVVTPVFERLREQLAAYTPEAAAKITGTGAETIRELARRIGRARAATILTQSNFSKFYHGLEMERVQILVLTLCGHVGKKGSGITGFPFMHIAGADALMLAPGSLPPKLGLFAVAAKSLPAIVKAKLRGLTDEMMFYELARQEYAKGGFVAAMLYFHRQGGIADRFGSARAWDPALQRDFSEFLDEALAKGWQFAPETRPRIFFEVGGNILRRIRSYDRLIDAFLPKLDLLVTVDWRMSNTALFSDYVFPAAAWYEKDDITWATPISPFAHVTTRAVDPLAESKTDWEFHCLFAKEIQKRAAQRGITTFRDRAGEARRLDRVYDELTFHGRYTERNPEALMEETLSMVTNLGGIGWSELKEKGFQRYTELGMSLTNLGNATDIAPDETITANSWHTDKKLPWPTLTRRMQFYIDHPFYLELGEELPVHKDNPPIGGSHPLQLTGGHARWSIHSIWRDQEHMQRLQRGEPLVITSTVDAESRDLADGDHVRVRNDVGSFEAQVKISNALRPGQVMVYHAWEPYQFRNRKSHQVLTPSPINPIQLAGGYFHLQPLMIVGEPGSTDRGTRVEIERVGSRRRT
jgi:DMSO reductase family type II enzyme molybdopterin subunit